MTLCSQRDNCWSQSTGEVPLGERVREEVRPSCLLLQSKNARDAVICLRTRARVHFSAPMWQRLLLLTGWETTSRSVQCDAQVRRPLSSFFYSQGQLWKTSTQLLRRCGWHQVWAREKKKRERNRKRERLLKRSPGVVTNTKTGINKDEEIKRKMWARSQRLRNDHFSHQQNEINDD